MSSHRKIWQRISAESSVRSPPPHPRLSSRWRDWTELNGKFAENLHVAMSCLFKKSVSNLCVLDQIINTVKSVENSLSNFHVKGWCWTGGISCSYFSVNLMFPTPSSKLRYVHWHILLAMNITFSSSKQEVLSFLCKFGGGDGGGGRRRVICLVVLENLMFYVFYHWVLLCCK